MQRSRYVIDRFAGGAVVVEDDHATSFRVPKEWVPSGAREGDVLSVTSTETGVEDRQVVVRVDEQATADRRLESRHRRDTLPKAPDGDFSL